jgi:N-acyl-D-amino-acid deacylase
MNSFASALVLLVLNSAAEDGAPSARGAPLGIDPGITSAAAEIRDAVGKGLKIVEKAARNYPENRSCFSCHHQTLPLLAMKTARERGLDIDEDLFAEQAKFTQRSFAGRIEELNRGEGIGGTSMTVGYGLWALDTAAWPRDAATAAMVAYLLKMQDADGSWKRYTSRPPLEDSNFTCTILAVYYMRKFAEPGQKDAVEAAAVRARDWLLSARPLTHEDAVSRLGALPLLGADPQRRESALEAILAAQRRDGGWAQLEGMESDAYATGLTLFTLQRLRIPSSHPAYQRGVRFLLQTQKQDGSWFVKSRSKPIQKFFDNGDPHGPDQFISIPATAWATTALALALEEPKRLRF